MRPPVCEVCESDFEPDAEGALITCVPRPEDLDWRRRSTVEGFVGHPPDTGWFCGRHSGRAAELAGKLHLGDVVEQLKAWDRERHHIAQPPPGGGASIGELFAALEEALPAVAAALGLDDTPVERRTHRDWTPMDGVEPPDCPFVDTTEVRIGHQSAALTLTFEAAHWSEEERARTTLVCALAGDGERDFRVAAWSPAAGAPDVIEDTRESGPLPPEISAALGLDSG